MDVIGTEEDKLCKEDTQRVSAPSWEVFKSRQHDLLAGDCGGKLKSCAGYLSTSKSQLHCQKHPGGTSPLIFICGNTLGPLSYPFYELKGNNCA